MMSFVVATVVIVIHCFLRVVIIDPEVSHDFGVERDVRPIWKIRLTLHVERLSIPAIESAMVLSLSYHVEDQILLHDVAASHPIVEVESSTRPIKANVVTKRR